MYIGGRALSDGWPSIFWPDNLTEFLQYNLQLGHVRIYEGITTVINERVSAHSLFCSISTLYLHEDLMVREYANALTV